VKLVIVADQNIPFVAEMYAGVADLRSVDGHAITPAAVRDADILLVRSVTPVTRELLDGSRVRFVGTATIGHDHVDRVYLDERGIAFVSAPGSNANSVSEYVTAALLEAADRLGWTLRGKTIGVIGVGNVGRRVVQKAEALGLKVLKNDPPVQRATGDASYVTLDEALTADIVTCHVPLTRTGEDATHHLINAERMLRMRPGALLLNSSRGAVVDGSALKANIRSGRLSAILDVWEGEPKIDAELLEEVLVGTPHIAGYSTEGKTNGSIMLYEAVCRYLGISATWSVDGKLPPPEHASIVPEGSDDESRLRSVIRKAYPIIRDDARLREMLTMDPDKRAEHFKRLRSHYPVRREFPAVEVIIGHNRPPLSGVLHRLGFKVVSVP
jgi:erythronate-4-phosphate dehydrogenase